MPDQEMRASFRYWEGAVTVSGTVAGIPGRQRLRRDRRLCPIIWRPATTGKERQHEARPGF